MSDRAHVERLVAHALASGDSSALEGYLLANSHLPGPRGNLELLHLVADTAGRLLTEPEPPTAALSALLDRWSAYPAPVTEPGVMLPCAAALTRGQFAASVPAQWETQIARMEASAQDDRWRVRELVAAGLQRMLSADWDRACSALLDWAASEHPQTIRAAVAGVAEPPLLKPASHAADALAVQQRAVASFSRFPAAERRSESVRMLRQALGYTLSVITVGTPEAGFDLLSRMAQSGDADLRWIVQENLKKGRLKPWPREIDRIQAELRAVHDAT